MKQYKTKTGVVLTCLQGEGLGDGIPRGKLSLVDSAFPKTEKSIVSYSDTTDSMLNRIRRLFDSSPGMPLMLLKNTK